MFASLAHVRQKLQTWRVCIRYTPYYMKLFWQVRSENMSSPTFLRPHLTHPFVLVLTALLHLLHFSHLRATSRFYTEIKTTHKISMPAETKLAPQKQKVIYFYFLTVLPVLTAKNWNPRLTLQILMSFYFLVLSCNDHKKTSMRTVTILTVKSAELHTFSSVSCLFKIKVRR